MSSAPEAPMPEIDMSDPLQYQVVMANAERDARALEEQASHIRFGGPDDIVPKANAPTKWSTKITETSWMFRGPETFTHQEMIDNHRNRRKPPGHVMMPSSQLKLVDNPPPEAAKPGLI